MILHKLKIVFAGSIGSGKTEAIKSLSEIPVLATEVLNTDNLSHTKMETTVGIDYGEVTLDDGNKIGLYGTPGQDRFNFMWNLICKGAIGVIVLVDHSLKNPLEELTHYVDIFKNFSDNITIGITHLDQDSKKNTHQYRQWLLDNNYQYPLFFIDARNHDDVLIMIEALVTTLEVKYL